MCHVTEASHGTSSKIPRISQDSVNLSMPRDDELQDGHYGSGRGSGIAERDFTGVTCHMRKNHLISLGTFWLGWLGLVRDKGRKTVI